MLCSICGTWAREASHAVEAHHPNCPRSLISTFHGPPAVYIGAAEFREKLREAMKSLVVKPLAEE